MLELKGSFDAGLSGGTVTSFSVSDGANALVLEGKFSGDAFFGALSDAIENARAIGGFLDLAGLLAGAEVVADADTILPDGFTSLRLAGAGHLNATGNAANNTLTGNDGDNTLDGGAGAQVAVLSGITGLDAAQLVLDGNLLVA